MSDLPPDSPSGSYVCRRCTACCRWPGDVRITPEETAQIAEWLKMPEHDFIEQCTRIHSDRNSLSILEKENDECLFLQDGGCLINPVKPQQCRDFPNKWNFPGWRDHCRAEFVEDADKKKASRPESEGV